MNEQTFHFVLIPNQALIRILSGEDLNQTLLRELLLLLTPFANYFQRLGTTIMQQEKTFLHSVLVEENYLTEVFVSYYSYI